MATNTEKLVLLPRSAVAPGDYLWILDRMAYGLVISRPDVESATVLMSNGEIVTRRELDARVATTSEPPEDFDADQLARRVVEREEMAEANRRAADMLRLAAEAAKAERAGLHNVAAFIAEGIGGRTSL